MNDDIVNDLESWANRALRENTETEDGYASKYIANATLKLIGDLRGTKAREKALRDALVAIVNGHVATSLIEPSIGRTRLGLHRERVEYKIELTAKSRAIVAECYLAARSLLEKLYGEVK